MKWRWLLMLVLLASNFFVWIIVWQSQPIDILQVSFLDVGQGDAILITAPNRNQVLIDGGPNKKVIRALGQVMPFFDRSIDLIIATHPDLDHIGGLPDTLDRFEVSAYLAPMAESKTAAYKTLQTKVITEGAQTVVAEKGMRVILAKDTTLEIFSAGTAGVESNAASVVAKLTYGDIDFLLTGDAPLALEEKLAYQVGSGLQAEILKVGHHGAKSSSGETFLQKVSPQFAVISAGTENRYGHPHVETIARLKEVGAEILQTKDLGTIVFETDGQSLNYEILP